MAHWPEYDQIKGKVHMETQTTYITVDVQQGSVLELPLITF